jgi:hypothetical protein
LHGGLIDCIQYRVFTGRVKGRLTGQEGTVNRPGG